MPSLVMKETRQFDGDATLYEINFIDGVIESIELITDKVKVKICEDDSEYWFDENDSKILILGEKIKGFLLHYYFPDDGLIIFHFIDFYPV